MGQMYLKGERKIRPGVYHRYENATQTTDSGTLTGVCAIPIRSDWGPLGAVNRIAFSEKSRLTELYGSGGTVNAVTELFNGGANTVYVYRLGTGGTQASVTLKDTTAETALDTVTVKALYPGTRKLSVAVREKLGSEDQKEFLVLENTQILETFQFAADKTQEPANLVEAVANIGSSYITAEKTADGNGTIAEVSNAALTGGQDPEVVNSDYSNAFNALEPYRVNCVTVDTIDADVREMLISYVERLFDAGKWCLAVVGDSTAKGFTTRLAEAKAINKKIVAYLGGGWKDAAEDIDGYRAVCRVCGVISSTPTSESVVHAAIPGAAALLESLTDSQMSDAYESGMLVVSQSPDGTIWLDNGVTTLTSPDENDDIGWKKIKRVMTRIELFDRLDRRLTQAIGKVNAWESGSIVQAAQSVLDAMVKETKLRSGALVTEDPENPMTEDSIWLIIQVDDIDTLEKIYLKYLLRASVPATA